MFRGVIDAGKETNKKEKLKMGRRKRHERATGPLVRMTGIRRGHRRGHKRQSELPMPSQRAKMDGDILRRDDAMKLEKPRGKFDVWLDRILGPEGDQL